MKNLRRIIFLFAVLACTIQSMQAYEYFTIYFTDGTKSKAFYATDVDSIRYSKLDVDSIEYADWQVQEIWTVDSVYRYPLSAIANLSFTDVDENKVAEDIASTSAEIAPIYAQCNSTEEISSRLSEIKSIIGVENAWTDHQTMFVEIKDFGVISYLYPPRDNSVAGYLADKSTANLSRTNKIKRTASMRISTHDREDAKSICIVNQQSKDETRQNKIYASTELEKNCKALGMTTKIESQPLPSFFENEIYNYDIIVLMTHGHYDEVSGLHWLTTSDELYVIKKHEKVSTDVLADIIVSRGYYKKYSTKDISITCIPEVRNGDSCQVYYATISNQFISKQKKHFDNYGNVIVFNTACQSLKGSPKDAYNLAYAFGQKGARSYLGYDESNQIGTGASVLYMLRLLNGQSTERAFETLPNEWKEEKFEYPEESGNKVNPILKHIHSTNYGITTPNTLAAEFDNDRVTIKGSIKILNPYGEEASNNEYGLIYSTSPNMENYRDTECEFDYDEQTHDVIMKYTFKEEDLQAGNKFYYCAYMNDGYSECYGEIKSFSMGEPYAVLNDEILTFYYDSKKDEREGTVYDVKEYYASAPAWSNQFTKAVFDISFANYQPTSTAAWFYACSSLKTIENLCYLNTSNVTNMGRMFYYCNSLTSLDLSSFITSNVTDMSKMFCWCSSLTSLDVSSFDTSNVTNMEGLFWDCDSLKSLDVSHFDTSNVTDMADMFWSCKSLKSLDVSSFDTSNVTNMFEMFGRCSSLLSLDLTHFDTTNVTNMTCMFQACSSLSSLDLSNFNTSNVTDMGLMFWCCDSLTHLDFRNLNLTKSYGTQFPSNIVFLDVRNIIINNYTGKELFKGLRKLKTLNLTNANTSNATDMHEMFEGCSSLTSLDLSSFNTSNVTNMGSMFRGCSSLNSLDVSSFNTSNVTNMGYMFSGCSSLNSLDVSSFNTSKVTDMCYMFNSCRSLTSLNLSSFNTSKVTDMHNMFGACSSLTSLDLSSFNTSNVTDMCYMFNSCKSLTSLDLSSFNTSNVTNMCWMFYGCSSLTSLDLSSFDTSNVTDMDNMFLCCSSLTSLDLSSFDTSNVTDMDNMFYGCSSLQTIYAGNWNVFRYYTMFEGCDALRGGKGTHLGKNLYGYDASIPLYYYCSNGGSAAHIDGGKDNPGLFTAK